MLRHSKLFAMALALPLSFAATASFASSEKADADEKKEWNVNGNQGGTLKDVSFSVDEGTWLNIDVSPDGKKIVFDMLGDIYLMPAKGGKAQRIIGDMSMDVQPQFSPDGTEIAFASDRDGGDNIYIYNIEEKSFHQVTDEDYRLLNNPVWTPDGQYLIARKHYNATRSLGAGEMWMYHRSGGAGMQLTERKNDQQDAGEPAVSPDGRYVYYSEDVSPGPYFQYNKDINGEVYQVKRLDRTTGETASLITGPGGAASPEPSPDGRYIAYVHRVREKTALYLFDRKSGSQIPLTDTLEHDQQAAWAIFGIYPSMAWSPKSDAIYYWGQGKIKRIDINSKKISTIEFDAQVDQQVVSAIRGNYKVDEGEFDVKMVRTPVISPKGDSMVFHALGYLWQQDLPKGTPKRLTDGRDFEYEPSFSADGKRVVYITHNDDKQSSIKVISLRTKRVVDLTPAPGFYRNPKFSPNSELIVFHKSRGTNLLGYKNTLDSGLYYMPSKGGEMTLITHAGREPSFDAAGTGIYYLTGGGLKKAFNHIQLDGRHQQQLFDLKYINHISPSPDGTQVAFTELYHSYVAPMPTVGKSISLSKDTKALPVTKLSDISGNYLTWANSNVLSWSTGANVYSADVRTLTKGDELKTENYAITIKGATDTPEGHFALTNARVITMAGDVIEQGAVVVKNNRIVAVGKMADIKIDSGVETFDLSGKTVMPGLIDAHAHANHFNSGPSTRANWAYYANLAMGVTTIHDPSATSEFVFSQAELVKTGDMIGPRVYSTGTILYGADGDFRVKINSLEDAQTHLKRMKANGGTSVKSYNQPRRNQRQQINQAARETDMLVVMEGGSTFYHNLSMIYDGSTGIEHNLPVAPLYNDVINLWKNTDVGYTPTLVVSYGGPSGEYYWYQHTDVFDVKPFANFLPQARLDERARRRLMIPEEEYFHVTVAKSAKKLSDEGVKVMSGGHGQQQGLAMHWEVWMMEQGGFTPLEAIATGTINVAEHLGLDKDLGSIEVGKLADLVIVDGNPLEDIRLTANTHMVVANGRVYETQTMNQLYPQKIKRPQLWFEREGAMMSPAYVDWAEETHAMTCPGHH